MRPIYSDSVLTKHHWSLSQSACRDPSSHNPTDLGWMREIYPNVPMSECHFGGKWIWMRLLYKVGPFCFFTFLPSLIEDGIVVLRSLWTFSIPPQIGLTVLYYGEWHTCPLNPLSLLLFVFLFFLLFYSVCLYLFYKITSCPISVTSTACSEGLVFLLVPQAWRWQSLTHCGQKLLVVAEVYWKAWGIIKFHSNKLTQHC